MVDNVSTNWCFERVLGSGGFGVIELWSNNSTGRQIAIKKCKSGDEELTEVQRQRWIQEVEIMKRLNHSNIVETSCLSFLSKDSTLPILYMEFCRKGDLRKVLNETDNCCGMNEQDVLKAMNDISSAIEYLHNHKITHRDLKPENVVLQNKDKTVIYKLIDLGYAKKLGETSTAASIVGTLHYLAPEILWKKIYSCSVDYWSLGILFYELLTGQRPFLHKKEEILTWMEYIQSKQYNEIHAYELEGKVIFGENIQEPNHLSSCMKNKLVEWFRVVLQWDPKQRGKQFNEIVVFKMLHSILSKKILYVFVVQLYEIISYQVNDNTSVIDFQNLIGADIDVPLNQQILTDYYGNILQGEIPILLQINNPVLFLFKNGNVFLKDLPAPKISIAQINYRETIFFVKREKYLFELYTFAVCIKVDLLDKEIQLFNEEIQRSLIKIQELVEEKNTISLTFQRIDKDKLKKIENLCTACTQMKIKLDQLMERNVLLKELSRKIDSVNHFSTIYDKAKQMFEDVQTNFHQPTKTTEYIKELINLRKTELCSEIIFKVTRELEDMEIELSKLMKSFNSVIVLIETYKKELQTIKKLISDSTSVARPSTLSDELTNIDNADVFNNLMILHTVDAFIKEIEENYQKIINFDP